MERMEFVVYFVFGSQIVSQLTPFSRLIQWSIVAFFSLKQTLKLFNVVSFEPTATKSQCSHKQQYRLRLVKYIHYKHKHTSNTGGGGGGGSVCVCLLMFTHEPEKNYHEIVTFLKFLVQILTVWIYKHTHTPKCKQSREEKNPKPKHFWILSHQRK